MNDQVLSEQKVEEVVRYLKWGVGLLALVGVVAALYFTFDGLAEKKSEKAFSALFAADKLEEQAAKEAEALKSSPEKVMLSWPEEKKKDFEAKLQKVVEEFKGSTGAALAGLRLARWNYLQQKTSDSQKIYESLVKEFSAKDKVLYRAMAFEGWGISLEAQNKLDEAAKVYDDALKISENPLKPLHLLGRARVLKAQGKTADAAGLFQKVIEEFPNSPYEKKARVLLATQGS